MRVHYLTLCDVRWLFAISGLQVTALYKPSFKGKNTTDQMCFHKSLVLWPMDHWQTFLLTLARWLAVLDRWNAVLIISRRARVEKKRKNLDSSWTKFSVKRSSTRCILLSPRIFLVALVHSFVERESAFWKRDAALTLTLPRMFSHNCCLQFITGSTAGTDYLLCRDVPAPQSPTICLIVSISVTGAKDRCLCGCLELREA